MEGLWFKLGIVLLLVMSIAMVLLVLCLIYERQENRKEVRSLLNRLMARDLPELGRFEQVVTVDDEMIRKTVRDKVEEIVNQGVTPE